MWYLLAIAACIAADQAVKLYVVSHLALYDRAPLLPGVVELFYIQNTGGGFSILTGHTWLLTALTAVLMAGLAVLMVKKVFDHPIAMWSMAAILGGGLGNLVDRVRLGYVVDMFNFQFMDYPVFNLADILVVCGTLCFAGYYLFLYGKEPKSAEKEGPGDGADNPDRGA